jgi:Tol biopolymer transport system component
MPRRAIVGRDSALFDLERYAPLKGEASGEGRLDREETMGMAGSRLGRAARLSLIPLVASFALAPLPAHAAFPGANGKIAFDSFNTPSFSGRDIWVINPDGTGAVDLTNTLTATTNDKATWSPDGQRIAFRSTRSGSSDVYTMNADGLGVTRLTTDPRTDTDPAWSPDGQKIVFAGPPGPSGDLSLYGSDIWVMNADGSNKVDVTNNPNCFEYSGPAWSPGGTKIAFVRAGVSSCDSEPNIHSPTIFVMNADGTGLSGGLAGGESPDWSPDGSKIAFTGVYVMNPDGTGITKVTSGNRWWPAWSPDGTKLAYSDTFSLYTANADGSGEVPIDPQAVYDRYPDWQPLPGLQRSEFTNAAQFCRADRDFLGDGAFRQKYGGAANAYGKCVSQSY